MITIYDIANVKDFWAEDKEIVDSFLKNVGLEDLLSAEEEQELLPRAVGGDKMAQKRLILANQRFIASIANQYQNRGLSLLELFNICTQGLVDAAMESASKPHDQRFIKFAVPYMRKAIEEEISTLDNCSK